ncbi:hypothetical protein B0H10DRAFT_1948500 [Mycena sp. CBHHK59/15]|nr:hypothetical protein B0H10DRAFT_1948500 [Mycena sp. CBHHK59/15]
MPLLLIQYPALFFLPTFSLLQRRAMAELAALLMCLPDTVLEQFCDVARPLTFRSMQADVPQSFTTNFRTKNAKLFSDTTWVDLDDLQAWLRQCGDLDHLLDPTSERNFPLVGLDPRSLYGMDGTFGDATFDLYPTVNFDQPRLSTPSSGLDLFDDNASEPNLNWDPSLAAFFNSVETPALESSSNPLFLPPDNLSFAALVSDPTGMNDGMSPALASGSNTSFFPLNATPSHALAPEPTAFPPPPQESFKFNDDNLRLMMQEEMDVAGEAWQWVPSDTIWLDKDVYIPPQPFPVTKNLKVVRIERIHGIPSQFPVPHTYKDEDSEMMNLNKILKDKTAPLLGRDSWRAGEKQSPHGERPALRKHRALCSCQGIFYCQSINPSLINVERYELDPQAQDAVNNTRIMQHLNQGSVIQDKVICYVNTVKGMKCTGKDASGGACGGYQILKQAAKASTISLVRFLSLNLIQELPSGRKYYFACSNHSGSWKNHSGIQIPPDVDEDLSFPHSKDGNTYVAAMLKLICEASTAFLVPLDEENIPLVIVIPKHLRPHTHPPPPDTKVPTHVRLLYEQAIRAFGISIATVNKVEQDHGCSPGIGSPFPSACTDEADNYFGSQMTRTRWRQIWMGSPPSAVITTFKNVLLECIQYVRSLNQDTTLKRIKAVFTFGRIYMDAKDADEFEFAWDKIDKAFFGATGKHLAFKAWDPVGWLVTVSGDMEAAPWIGMARSFIKRMDVDKHPSVDVFLAKVCGYAIGMPSIWWNHKLNHKWLLPGLLECLSGLSHEDWLTTPFTSNGNETQHHWTNSQTGIGLNAVAKADHAVGEQFEASLASGIMTSNRNELSHCTTCNAKRHTSAIEKAKRAGTQGRARHTRGRDEAKDATARPRAPKKIAADEMELDGIQMTSPEVQVEPDVQPDALEQENDVDVSGASQSESVILANLDVDDDGTVISLGDSDVGVPSVNSISPPTPSPIPPHSEPPEPPSTRRSSRKRGASITHDDAPTQKSKKTEAAAAPEPSSSGKKRRVTPPHYLQI